MLWCVGLGMIFVLEFGLEHLLGGGGGLGLHVGMADIPLEHRGELDRAFFAFSFFFFGKRVGFCTDARALWMSQPAAHIKQQNKFLLESENNYPFSTRTLAHTA